MSRKLGAADGWLTGALARHLAERHPDDDTDPDDMIHGVHFRILIGPDPAPKTAPAPA